LNFKFNIVSMYVKRTLSSVLLRACRQFPAVLVTGPRQSGKTTLLQEELGPLGYASASFDDPVLREFAQVDPNGFLDRFEGKDLMLDEVQYVPGLFSYLKVRIDADRGRQGRFVCEMAGWLPGSLDPFGTGPVLRTWFSVPPLA